VAPAASGAGSFRRRRSACCRPPSRVLPGRALLGHASLASSQTCIGRARTGAGKTGRVSRETRVWSAADDFHPAVRRRRPVRWWPAYSPNLEAETATGRVPSAATDGDGARRRPTDQAVVSLDSRTRKWHPSARAVERSGGGRAGHARLRVTSVNETAGWTPADRVALLAARLVVSRETRCWMWVRRPVNVGCALGRDHRRTACLAEVGAADVIHISCPQARAVSRET
jgi:hypothetical protein